MRVVFDTNVVISALVFGRHLGWLRTAWSEQAIIPIVCLQTVSELIRVLAYPKMGVAPERQTELVEHYLQCAEMMVVPEPWPHLPVRCRDVTDEMFLALAIQSESPLVSGDAHLTSLASLATIPILTVAELQIWVQGDQGGA